MMKKESENIQNKGVKIFLVIGFLLFAFGIFKWGVAAASPIALLPFLIWFVAKFSKPWTLFWTLFVVNFTIMGLSRYVSIPAPISFIIEALYVSVIISIFTSKSKIPNWQNGTDNFMTFVYSVWVIFCILELANNTCGLQFSELALFWYTEVRMLAFQILYVIIIMSTLFQTKSDVKKYTYVWSCFAIFAVVKCLGQQYLGFDYAEKGWVMSVGMKTHFVNGIIRYFSFFTDASNFGCNMAATAVVFLCSSFVVKEKYLKILFVITMLGCIYGMMASGTRTAIFVFAGGMLVYSVLSKNFKALGGTLALLIAIMGFLMLTDIGQGNSMIRRMRSAFDKNDASKSVREENQDAMAKYLRDAPWGIGLGVKDLPQNNPNWFLSIIAPDSTLVYIWIRTGIIGLTIFLTIIIAILLKASMIVFFDINDKELRGILSGFVSAGYCMLVAGYGNQIMLQFPNALLFFGGLALVYNGKRFDQQIAEEHSQEKTTVLIDSKVE